MPKRIPKPSVLVVDDNKDFLILISSWLSPHYQVFTRTTGDELLEEIEAIDPDLLILDVRIPGADGFQLCKEIRSDRRFEDLPILFLTASNSDQAFIKNIEVGGTAYLTKSANRQELLDMIEELLGAYSRSSL